MWLHADIRSLGDIPRHYARTQPAKTAVIDPAGSLTFLQLDEQSSRVATGLLGMGIPNGSHIGYFGKNACSYFTVLFGANKADCAVAPLNWRLAVPEVAAILADAQCPLIFADTEFMAVLRAALAAIARPCRIVELGPSGGSSEFSRWLADASALDPLLPVSPWRTALLMYTSGTTGDPKGVQIADQGLTYMRLCEHLEPALAWRSDDLMLTVMPVFHLVGTGLSLQALYNGSTVSLLPALDPAQLVQVIARDQPTIVALVPTAIQMLLDHPDSLSADFSSLRLVMYAGSPISEPLLNRAMARMHCSFMQFYGATETAGAATLLRPEQHRPGDEVRLRSCGTPLPLIEMKVMDPEGNELGVGEVGELGLRAPSLFVGYLNKPEATAAVMDRGWYRTGDAGFRDEEGFFYIVDRVKDMIVTGGENVYSAEVERVLLGHAAVKQCAIIGLPDRKWGERVVAVVGLDEAAVVTAEELAAHCRAAIAGYKVPKQFLFVRSLPMTPSGKVLKRRLRDEIIRDLEG